MPWLEKLKDEVKILKTHIFNACVGEHMGSDRDLCIVHLWTVHMLVGLKVD